MDRERSEIIKMCLGLLEEEKEEEREESGPAQDERFRFETRYDPGYARLRKLGWPGCDM